MPFSQDLQDFAVEVKTKHKANAEAIEDFVYNMIRTKSPRKSGAYQANHHRTSAAPDYSWNPDKTSGVEPAPTGGQFPTFFVATGCPYAEELENGHSMQAPFGVYGVTLHAAKVRFGL